MKLFERYEIRKILMATVWVMTGIGCIVLLAAAVHSSNHKRCRGLEINIHGVRNNFFIGKDDVKRIISSYAGKNITGVATNAFNLVAMEAELKRDVWIRDAEMFFDNNDILQVYVEEREPIARLFTTTGNSFYIDETKMILPISEKLSARLPVFTGFPTENKVLTKADSNLLHDVKTLSILIQHDPFLMGMIDQVDITPDRSFEMIPKIGDQVIVFGDATDAAQKFRKLQLFYKKVMTKYGWSRYSIINLQYKGQVVGKIKGKDDVSADSLRTVEIMHAIAVETARRASDSLQMFIQDNEKNTTQLSLIERSMERDDEVESPINALPRFPEVSSVPVAGNSQASIKPVSAAAKKPAVKNSMKQPQRSATKPVVKPTRQPSTQPKTAATQNKPAGTQPKPAAKPKAVMPKNNDY